MWWPKGLNFIYLCACVFSANAFVRQALSDMSEIVNVSLLEAARENKSVFMNFVLFMFLAKINILIQEYMQIQEVANKNTGNLKRSGRVWSKEYFLLHTCCLPNWNGKQIFWGFSHCLGENTVGFGKNIAILMIAVPAGIFRMFMSPAHKTTSALLNPSGFTGWKPKCQPTRLLTDLCHFCWETSSCCSRNVSKNWDDSSWIFHSVSIPSPDGSWLHPLMLTREFLGCDCKGVKSPGAQGQVISTHYVLTFLMCVHVNFLPFAVSSPDCGVSLRSWIFCLAEG